MRVHLIDGTYELFRAHFSKRPRHTAPDGRDLKGTVGVVSSLMMLLDDAEEQVTHLAAAFDNPIRSFRNDLYDGYKTDEGVPPELLAQFDEVEAGVAALGVAVCSMKEFEADDALATAAVKYKQDKRVKQVRVMTPDKDLGAVVDGTRVVQVDRMRQRVIDEATFRTEKGLAPESVPDFLALVGDAADGIPGLEGWGKTGATTVLAKYPHLEDIPADPSQWKVTVRGAERLAAVLADQQKEVKLWRKLATLRFDVPLKQSLDDLEFKGVPKKKFLAWCERVGAKRLPERVKRWAE